MSQAKALYKLQQIDQNISQAKNRLAEIATELADNVAVQQASAKVEAAQTRLVPLQKAARELEHEIETTTNKAKQSEDRLYSGNVKNPKELQDLQNEIHSLKQRGDELEERLLEKMMEVEEAETSLQSAEETLQETETATATENQHLIQERDSLQKKVEALQNDREVALEPISDDSLKQYDALKPRTRGLVVAVMRDGTCSACGVQQNRAIESEVRRNQSIVPCGNCGRILVLM